MTTTNIYYKCRCGNGEITVRKTEIGIGSIKGIGYAPSLPCKSCHGTIDIDDIDRQV
jgi:hypothetical protein